MLMTDVSQGPWKLVKAPPHDDKQTVSRAICIPVCIVRHFVCVQCVCARVCLSLSMTFGTLQLLVKMLFSGVTQRTSLKLRKYRISLYYLCGQILFCRKSCVRHFHETALSIIIFWRTVRTLIYGGSGWLCGNAQSYRSEGSWFESRSWRFTDCGLILLRKVSSFIVSSPTHPPRPFPKKLV